MGGNPGQHGGVNLERRPAKPSLDHILGVTNGGMPLGTLLENQSTEFHDTEEDFSETSPAEPAETSPQGKMRETVEQQDQWELCSELSDASSFSLISEQTDSSWVQVDG